MANATRLSLVTPRDENLKRFGHTIMPIAPPGRGVTITRTSAAGRSPRTQAAHVHPTATSPPPSSTTRSTKPGPNPDAHLCTHRVAEDERVPAAGTRARTPARTRALGRACTRRGSVPMAVTEVRSTRDDPVGHSKVLVVLRYSPTVTPTRHTP